MDGNEREQSGGMNITSLRLEQYKRKQAAATLIMPAIDEAQMLMLKYSPEILDELEGLARGKRQYAAVVVDCTICGYGFPSELLVEASRLVDCIIELRGALVFLRTDSACAIVKEYISSAPTFRVFSSYAELFDFSPQLAKFIKTTMGTDAGFDAQSADLAQQILLSAIPVMTKQGIAQKAAIEQTSNENHVLSLIDNYSPVASLMQRSKNRLSEDEVLLSLRELEQKNLIFPLFAKIPFLATCFKNRRTVSLEEYLTNCRILPQSRVDELNLHLGGVTKKERMSLGAFSVKKGVLTARLLEVAMQDLAFYTQSDTTKNKAGKAAATAEEERVQSLVGYLASTDPMSLLQNMATNRETGVLSVENRDMQFKASFEVGKASHARMGKLHGNDAIVEFASAWRQGIFVFIKREPPADLLQPTCKLTKALEKLMLDAALAQDNTEVVWKKLSKGSGTILEKVEKNRPKLEGEPLYDLKENHPISTVQMEMVKNLWQHFDGLTPISRVVKDIGTVTTADAAWATDLMLEYNLVRIPDGDLTAPVEKFQRLTTAICDHIGSERNSAFLRLSLRDTLGFSGRARVFSLSKKGEVGVNMAALKQSGISLSDVLSDLENWQVKYIEYVNQDLDRALLLSIIKNVHQG